MRANASNRAGKVNWGLIGGIAFGLCVLLCAGGGIGGYFIKTSMDQRAEEAERKRILDALEPELASYVSPKDLRSNAGKFKGKAVCVDKTKNKIDPDSLIHLPDTWKATKPEEVGAIVWIKWSDEVVGEFDDGSKSKVYVASVTLIDKAKSDVLVVRRIKGDPVSQKRGSGDRMGPKPWDKIADLLKEFVAE